MVKRQRKHTVHSAVNKINTMCKLSQNTYYSTKLCGLAPNKQGTGTEALCGSPPCNPTSKVSFIKATLGKPVALKRWTFPAAEPAPGPYERDGALQC